MKKYFFMLVLFFSLNLFAQQNLQELYNLSVQYYQEGNIELAIKYGEEALLVYEKEYGKKDSQNYLTLKNNLGVFYKAYAEYEKAEPLLKETLEMSRRLFKGDHQHLASSLTSMAMFYNGIGKFNESEPLLKEALEMSRRLFKGDDLELAIIINNMAYFYDGRGRYSEAESLYQESLEMKRRIFKNDDPDLANGINNMGMFYNARGKTIEAELLLKEALVMYRRLFKGDHPDLAQSINNMAMFYNSRGRYTEVEPLLKEAIEMNRRLFKSDHPILANSINNMAMFYNVKGSYSEAESLLKESLEMYRRMFKSDHPNLATSINNMAVFYDDFGNYSEAEILLKEALNMRRRLFKGDHPDLANGIFNMAFFYHERGRNKEVEPLIKEALEMYRRLYKWDNPNLASSINSLAVFYIDESRYTKAEPLLKEALEMRRRLFQEDHPDLANSINNMAEFYYRRGNYTEAEPLYKEALEMSKRIFKEDHSDLVLSINNIALFYNDKGRYSEAEPLFLEVLKIHKKMLANYSASLSEKEKDEFINTFSFYFEEFNSLALKWSKVDTTISSEQYNNQLLTKSYLLNSNKKINKRIFSSGNKELIDKYKKLKSIREQISFLSSLTVSQFKDQGYNYDSLKIAANELEKDLSKKSELFANAFDKKEFTWKDVQAKLKEGEAAVEIIRFKYYNNKNWTDTVYYSALLVTKETKDYPKLVLLENGNELEDKYFRLYKAEIESGIGNFPKEFDPEGNLYKAFWAKIGRELEGIKKVYLSLDGVYNQINLATLRNPQTKEYLIDEKEIVLVTNTKDLVTDKPYKAKNNEIVLFGYPNYKLGMQEQKLLAANIPRGEEKDVAIYGSTRDSLTKRYLSDLPQTKEEVEDIEKIMNKHGWKTKTYLGDKALEEEVKNINSPRVLHISTHGQFLSDIEIDRNEMNSRLMGMETKKYVENPLMRSMLFFAGSQRTINNKGTVEEGIDNGILTAYEAMNLNLDNTELVVLSACETGLGEIKNGEGVYGMQRAFQTAGARYVLMSLWSVNAKSSQELMEAFYKYWIKIGDIKKAFKEAQKEIREKYPLPYHWGAFVLVGE